MASYTFYSATADGQVTASDASYSNCKDGTASKSSSSAATTLRPGKSNSAGTHSYIQAFLGFDTSSIPDDAEITSAVLSLYPSATKGLTWVLQARSYDWGASVGTADYRTSAEWDALTLLASYDLTSGWTAGAYVSLTEYGTNLSAAINKTGTTNLMLAGGDFNGIGAPTDTDYTASFYAAEQTGTTSDPKLEVTTFEPPAFTPFVMWIS